jgi:hypothetical protein
MPVQSLISGSDLEHYATAEGTAGISCAVEISGFIANQSSVGNLAVASGEGVEHSQLAGRVEFEYDPKV